MIWSRAHGGCCPNTKRNFLPLLALWRDLFSQRLEALKMTKAELIETLTDLADNAEILIEAWPDTGQQRADVAALPRCGELYAIKAADIIPAEGDNAAFLTLKPDTEFKVDPAPPSND
jgi:hypothetical protein